jgi:hypothetical protein
VEYSSYGRANEQSLAFGSFSLHSFALRTSVEEKAKIRLCERRRQAATPFADQNAFHHQGLARLGATPFRDAVAFVGEALCVSSSGSSPAEAARYLRFTQEKLHAWRKGSIRGLDVRRGSLTLRARGPYARRYLVVSAVQLSRTNEGALLNQEPNPARNT